MKQGLRENWQQFTILVIINMFVGGMVGLERTILPDLAQETFLIGSTSVILSFIVVFGVSKAVTNYLAGALANRVGRKNLLVMSTHTFFSGIHCHKNGKLEGINEPNNSAHPFSLFPERSKTRRSCRPFCFSMKQGLRENWQQFTILVIINMFVGGMVGLERTILPDLAQETFLIGSTSVILSFIVVFGVSKAVTNYLAGALANRVGRKNLLVMSTHTFFSGIHCHKNGKLEGINEPNNSAHPFSLFPERSKTRRSCRPPPKVCLWPL